eukprot:PhM_4_TR265/c0_g1_i1/m.1615
MTHTTTPLPSTVETERPTTTPTKTRRLGDDESKQESEEKSQMNTPSRRLLELSGTRESLLVASMPLRDLRQRVMENRRKIESMMHRRRTTTTTNAARNKIGHSLDQEHDPHTFPYTRLLQLPQRRQHWLDEENALKEAERCRPFSTSPLSTTHASINRSTVFSDALQQQLSRDLLKRSVDRMYNVHAQHRRNHEDRLRVVAADNMVRVGREPIPSEQAESAAARLSQTPVPVSTLRRNLSPVGAAGRQRRPPLSGGELRESVSRLYNKDVARRLETRQRLLDQYIFSRVSK